MHRPKRQDLPQCLSGIGKEVDETQGMIAKFTVRAIARQ